MEIITRLPVLAPRVADSNKGSFGKVLVVAGSRGMAGAAVLCGSAVLRAGAGLVRVAVPRELQPTVAAGNPCYTTLGLPQDEQGRFNTGALIDLRRHAAENDVIALGPGLGRSPGLAFLVSSIVEQIHKPLVLDADGLNAIVDQPGAVRNHHGPLIISPHPGEFARLLHCPVHEVQNQRQELAVRFAHAHCLIVVLKGHGTIVTDGQRAYHNTTGNPGMATAGTGDVLTGIIAALLGQGLGAFDAAVLGVYLHGLAGDRARAELGEVSLIATDLLTFLPPAILQHQRGL